MKLGLEICALHPVGVKEISIINLMAEEKQALALLVGGLRAGIKRGVKTITVSIKGAD
jgi:hypothetical protein